LALPLGFTATVIYVSLVAALAAVVTVRLSLEIWMMFVAWTCFSLSAGNVRRAAAAIVCLMGGVLLGMGSIVLLGAISPVLTEIIEAFAIGAVAAWLLVAGPELVGRWRRDART
jgi:hypothetical protein